MALAVMAGYYTGLRMNDVVVPCPPSPDLVVGHSAGASRQPTSLPASRMLFSSTTKAASSPTRISPSSDAIRAITGLWSHGESERNCCCH